MRFQTACSGLLKLAVSRMAERDVQRLSVLQSFEDGFDNWIDGRKFAAKVEADVPSAN